MYRGRWDDCIRTLKDHLNMPTALWRDERAASMRYIAKSYWEKGEAAARGAAWVANIAGRLAARCEVDYKLSKAVQIHSASAFPLF